MFTVRERRRIQSETRRKLRDAASNSPFTVRERRRIQSENRARIEESRVELLDAFAGQIDRKPPWYRMSRESNEFWSKVEQHAAKSRAEERRQEHGSVRERVESLLEKLKQEEKETRMAPLQKTIERLSSGRQMAGSERPNENRQTVGNVAATSQTQSGPMQECCQC